MGLTTGTRLGPYEILSPLGTGGMGEVYRARDTRLDRTVAIKILNSTLATSPELKQRFEREARAISQLQHAHICTLYDIGQQEGTDFLVMEYLEGETLADRLHRGALPLTEILRIGSEIADALSKAHSAGIIHRDLKPGNIMLTRSGAKLLDFGLAKPAGLAVAAPRSNAPLLSAAVTMTSPSPQLSPLTTQGTIVGTVQYMSPEQIEGKEADAHSDIFALGAVLYEMATGKRAFQGKSQIKVASAILEDEPPPLSSLRPGLPDALELLVAGCLKKDPDQRWQSASDLKMQIDWLRKMPSAALDRGLSLRTKVAIAVAIAVIAILASALLLFSHLRAKPTADLIQAYISAPDKNTFSLMEDDSSGPAVISRGGHYLAFVAINESGNHQLWIRDLAQNTSSALQGTEGAIYPFWSPDERSIGFFAGGKLKRVSIQGGAVISICDTDRAPRGGSWSSGGSIIFTRDSQTTLSVVSENGGTPRTVTRMENYHTTHRWPVFLPDGRHFLYLATNHNAPNASERNGIYVGSIDDPTARFLIPANSNFAVASGYLLFLQNDGLMAQPFDAARAQLTGSASAIGPQIYRNNGTWRGGFDASSNGVLVYHPATGEHGSQLLWMDRSGKALMPLGEREVIRSMSLSPDGQRLAVEAGDPAALIWIYDAVRGTRSRLTLEGTGDTSPVWSPDGNRVAFAERHGGPYDVYVKNSNFSGAEELVFASPEDKTVFDWSPDGSYLLVGMGQPAALWLLPLTGERKPQHLLRGPSPIWDGKFSPDGRWLAYETDETGRNEIYLTRFPSLEGKWRVSSNGGREMAWRRDGKAIFYLARDGNLTEAALAFHGEDFEISAVKPLFKLRFLSLTPLSPHQYVPARDGQRFLVAEVGEEGFSTLNLMIHWTAALHE